MHLGLTQEQPYRVFDSPKVEFLYEVNITHIFTDVTNVNIIKHPKVLYHSCSYSRQIRNKIQRSIQNAGSYRLRSLRRHRE